MITQNDIDILNFLHNRLVEKYKESPNIDYLIKARDVIGYLQQELVSGVIASHEQALPIQHVSNSLPDDVPLFVDWLDKYYTHAGNDDLYKRKDNGKIETQRKLYNDYKRAYKLGNDC